MPDLHTHVIAAQDYATSREWWTIRVNEYTREEAEQQARQLLAETPDDQADRDDLPETDAGQPEPGWSAIWLTSCTGPCTWAAAPASHVWTLPPPGSPWWTADGLTTHPPARTGNVALVTIQTASWAELRRMGLTDTDLTMLGATQTDLATLTPHPSDRPRTPHPWTRPQSGQGH